MAVLAPTCARAVAAIQLQKAKAAHSKHPHLVFDTTKRRWVNPNKRKRSAAKRKPKQKSEPRRRQRRKVRPFPEYELYRDALESVRGTPHFERALRQLATALVAHQRRSETTPARQRAIREAMREIDMTPIGEPGEQLKFNSLLHESSESIWPGEEDVVVVHPGWRLGSGQLFIRAAVLRANPDVVYAERDHNAMTLRVLATRTSQDKHRAAVWQRAAVEVSARAARAKVVGGTPASGTWFLQVWDHHGRPTLLRIRRARSPGQKGAQGWYVDENGQPQRRKITTSGTSDSAYRLRIEVAPHQDRFARELAPEGRDPSDFIVEFDE